MRQRLAFLIALAMTAFVVALALIFAVLLNPKPAQASELERFSKGLTIPHPRPATHECKMPWVAGREGGTVEAQPDRKTH